MSRFNTSSTHPIIPNLENYMYEKKYVSIHSEDRNYTRFPESHDFEVELPQDYCNVQSVKLSQWAFPANYDVFSLYNNNILMTFKITNPYNPMEHAVSNPLLEIIFTVLDQNIENEYAVVIEEGFYTPDQMATELTNKMNAVITKLVLNYLNEQPIPDKVAIIQQFIEQNGYNQFVVAYNLVNQKLWFGNKSSNFVLTNSQINTITNTLENLQCQRANLPNFSRWGLPAFLGFTRCDAETNSSSITQNNLLTELPRFYYGDYKPGDNGYWLIPDPEYLTPTVYYLEAPKKINLMGDAYIYMEIFGMNNIDETDPWSLSCYTLQTNPGTNGIVNSSFAKIAVPTTPISQWFDIDSPSYKWYNPPAERIRKIRVKLRYHDNSPVRFNDFDFSFTLEFNILNPQFLQTKNKFNL